MFSDGLLTTLTCPSRFSEAAIPQNSAGASFRRCRSRITPPSKKIGYPDLSVFPAQRQSRDTRERNRILLLRAPACHEILKPDLTVGATEHGALL